MSESRRAMARRRPDSPPFPPVRPDFTLEAARIALGARVVAGVDEAGRGPLAGPVVAAAVVLDERSIPAGLDDSKKLSVKDRERLFAEILATSAVAVASVGAGTIDRLNIRQATLLAMRRATAALPTAPDHCLIDGTDVPTALSPCASAVVSGDALSLSVAAASIVAKVTRDRLMTRLCAWFPAYGFSRHMGYGTKLHLDALKAHGPCAQHRFTFGPVRNAKAAGLRGGGFAHSEIRDGLQ